MKRLLLIAGAALALAATSNPAGACAAAEDPCLEDDTIATITGRVYLDRDADGRFDPAVDAPYGSRVFLDLDRDAAWDEGEPVGAFDDQGRYRLRYRAALQPDGDTVSVRLDRFRAGDGTTYVDCSSPAGCAQDATVAPGREHRDVDFGWYGNAGVHGHVFDDRDGDGRREAGEPPIGNAVVWLDEDQDGEADGGEPQYRTPEHTDTGWYSLTIHRRHVGRFGGFPPIRVQPPRGAYCTAPRSCTIAGLPSRSESAGGQDFGVQRPAIVYVPGLGGSEIACGNRSLWFTGAPLLDELRLDASGTRGDARSACSAGSGPSGRAVRTLGAMDLSGGAIDHYEQLVAPDRFARFTYDWRREPEDAIARLDRVVDDLRSRGAGRVQLVGHGLGGLVIQAYIAAQGRADKVERAALIGTPSLGTPSALLAIASGAGTPGLSRSRLLDEHAAVRDTVRTWPSLYAMLPAAGYGPAFTVPEVDARNALDVDGLGEYVRRIGASERHQVAGASAHSRLFDRYADNGVDVQVVAGYGWPTVSAAHIRHGVTPQVITQYAAGDRDVPFRSAAHDAPADRVHHVCGPVHDELPAHRQTTKLLDDWLVKGTAIDDPRAECTWASAEIRVHHPDALSDLATAASAGVRVRAAGAERSLAQAERDGLVDVLDTGNTQTILTRPGTPVTLTAGRRGTTLSARALTDRGAGPRRHFGPVTGPVTIAARPGAVPAVTRNGRPVKAVRAETAPPVTTVTVRPRGTGLVLTAKAKDASQIAATYVLLGKQRRRYAKPMRLTRKQAKTARVGSVDVWGNAETPRKVRLPRSRR